MFCQFQGCLQNGDVPKSPLSPIGSAYAIGEHTHCAGRLCPRPALSSLLAAGTLNFSNK
jgi:hypothetical protein